MIGINKAPHPSLRLFALASSLAAAPAFADGECLEWNVAGVWRVHQSNGTDVLLRLQQTDRVLQGVGEYSYYDNDADKEKTISGPIDGQLEQGFRVRASVYWSNGTVGLYVGDVQPDGGMNGYAHERADINNKATFTASGFPICTARAVAPPPAPPAETVKALGRVQLPAGTPTAPAKTICESAAAARARNSPAAPGLEKQCAAQQALVATAVSANDVPRVTPPAPLPPIAAAKLDELAAKGGPIAQADPQTAILFARQAEGAGQRGFLIGMAAAENDTAPGPGKQHIHDSLGIDEQTGFDNAVTYLLARNSNKGLAATGAEIAGIDPAVATARVASQDVFYQLGFDIATGLFGDPALGAQGNTLMGPGSAKIRDSLNAAGQRGFNDSVAFHLARKY